MRHAIGVKSVILSTLDFILAFRRPMPSFPLDTRDIDVPRELSLRDALIILQPPRRWRKPVTAFRSRACILADIFSPRRQFSLPSPE